MSGYSMQVSEFQSHSMEMTELLKKDHSHGSSCQCHSGKNYQRGRSPNRVSYDIEEYKKYRDPQDYHHSQEYHDPRYQPEYRRSRSPSRLESPPRQREYYTSVKEHFSRRSPTRQRASRMITNIKHRMRSKSPIRDAREDLAGMMQDRFGHQVNGIEEYKQPTSAKGIMLAGMETNKNHYGAGVVFAKVPREVTENRSPYYRD